MTGSVGILNVGAGDTKLVFDPSKPDEVKKSAAIVTDMIRRGFVLLIEVGHDEKGPVYRRAHDFDPETAEYIVAGAPAETIEKETPTNAKPKSTPRRRSRKAQERIPASSTKAVAVARVAGG